MIKEGVCRVCGCVQNDACEEGCAWADPRQTLCTACAPLTSMQQTRRRRSAIAELTMRAEITVDEMTALLGRLQVLHAETR